MIYSISDYKALIDLSKEDNNVLFGVALSLFNFATKIWLYFLVLAYLFSKWEKNCGLLYLAIFR